MDNSKDLELQLDELKQQIAVLKSRLSEENILTREVLENATKNNVSKLKNMAIIQATACVCLTPLIFWDMYFFLKLPLLISIVTSLFLLYAAFSRIYKSRHLFGTGMMTMSVVDRAYAMVRFKKRNIRGLYCGIAFLVVWLPWFFYEITKVPQLKDVMQSVALGAAVGSSIGLFFGIKFFLKEMNLINETINNLTSLEK